MTHSAPTPDESLLLAWVEGEPLPEGDERRVAEYLRVNPTSAQKLEAMRADRELIRGLDDEVAPDDLLQRVGVHVVPLLERRMLLEDQAPLVTSRKLKLVGVTRRPSLVRTLFLESTGRRILVAAAGLLIAGAGVYFAATTISNPGIPASTQSATIGPSTSAKAHEPDTPHPTLAESIPPIPEVESPTTALVMGPVSPEPPWSLEGLVENERHAREQGIITPSAAIDLAQRGSLILRVRASNPSFDPANLEEVLRQGDGAWALVKSGEDPGDLLEDAAVVRNLPSISQDSTSIASSRSALFVVQTKLDTQSLTSLCHKLREAKVQVSFERRDRTFVPDTFAVTGACAHRGVFAPPGWSPVPIVVDKAMASSGN